MRLATEFTLNDAHEAEERRDKIEMLYEYDIGRGWECEILFLGKESGGLRMAISGLVVQRGGDRSGWILINGM